MTAKKIDLFSLYGINPNEWYFMYVRDLGLDSVVTLPPHAEHHYLSKCCWVQITKPNGDICSYPAFKGEIMQSPGVIDACGLAPFSQYEAMGYKISDTNKIDMGKNKKGTVILEYYNGLYWIYCSFCGCGTFSSEANAWKSLGDYDKSNYRVVKADN
jgi:hypothetical protein